MGKSRRLSAVGEFGWLKKLLPRLYWPSALRPHLCIGPGDDAGALRITPGRVLVATTDTLVEGIHFEHKWMSPRDLGHKLLAVNLSDLAAMGRVKPLAVLVTVSMPGDTLVDSLNNFYQGLRGCAQRWKIGFLGGDTVGSRGSWTVSATVLGEAHPNELIQRGGAKAGDLIAVIGPLGLATAGLEIVQSGARRAPWMAPLITALCRPQPLLDSAQYLSPSRGVTSLIDASDGLEASVKLLSECSGLGAELQLSHIPVSRALDRWARIRKRNPLSYIVPGGEDYALIFTVRSKDWPMLHSRLPQAKMIGRMVPKGHGCTALSNGQRISLKNYGYAHFHAS